MRGCISPRFIRRTATVDTNMMHKEEFDEFMQVNQYKVVGIIGSGSYGIVHKATTGENDIYVSSHTTIVMSTIVMELP
jgi:hypothetical protein